jgi:phosphoglycerate dehydrogenase-like enzyme
MTDSHVIALVMLPGLERRVFEPADLQRLEHAGTLVSTGAFPNVSAIPDDIASSVSVLVTGWGTPSIGAAAVERLPNLGLVAHAAGTVKAMVTPELYRAGVTVTSAADANAVPVAEFTLAAVVMVTKQVFRIRDAHRSARGTEWAAQLLDWTLDARDMGNRGRTIGLVGASRIGRLVARGLRGFDCQTLIHDPYLAAGDAAELGASKVELGELCSRSDIVSLHAPDLPSTRRMIGAEHLALMRNGAWLINTARGALLDTAAATGEAESGRLNLFLDTTDPEPLPEDSPLYDLPNVVLTPHIAGSLGSEIARMGDAAVTEVERFVAGEPARFPVREADLGRIA